MYVFEQHEYLISCHLIWAVLCSLLYHQEGSLKIYLKVTLLRCLSLEYYLTQCSICTCSVEGIPSLVCLHMLSVGVSSLVCNVNIANSVAKMKDFWQRRRKSKKSFVFAKNPSSSPQNPSSSPQNPSSLPQND